MLVPLHVLIQATLVLQERKGLESPGVTVSPFMAAPSSLVGQCFRRKLCALA